MRRAFHTACCLLACCAIGPLGVVAQSSSFPIYQDSLPVASISQDRLFSSSEFGKAALAKQREDAAILSAENARIVAELEKEELDLKEKRSTMDPDAFKVLAKAFDERVVEIRARQEQKSVAVSEGILEARRVFSNLTYPILLDLMRERGIEVILHQQAIWFAGTDVDITEQAIEQVDRVLGSGGPNPDQ